MEEKYIELIHKAQLAYENAYAPYSNYKVGAAVLWDSGAITTGVNMENASYGLTVCAERNAIAAGIGTGERKIDAIAIAVPSEDLPAPCGACRQVLREFSTDCTILLANGKRESKITDLKKLFPYGFGPEFLKKL
ncbi:MAG: cytidine deaminase [Gracilibacter sp. BRH_c7a]|nr:MAG: cytidine deaminase [Gracilibacter sp. BRH_c7a]